VRHEDARRTAGPSLSGDVRDDGVKGNGWDSTADVDAVVDGLIAVLKRRAVETTSMRRGSAFAAR
jgi:hypothetical protein